MGEWKLTLLEYHGHGDVDIMPGTIETESVEDQPESDGRWVAGVIGLTFLIGVGVILEYLRRRKSTEHSEFEQVAVTEYEN